jgi:gag-polypeptide of LTR copia-type
MLLGWIRSSLTEIIQGQVAACQTTTDLWSCLKHSYSATYNARLTDLRRQINSSLKGSSSCIDYLNRLRGLSDELSFIGFPMSDDDLISALLNGLGPEYNSFVTSVTTSSRHLPFTFSELHGALLNYESRLQGQSSAQSVSLSSTDFPNAFYAKPKSNNSPSFQKRSYNPQPHTNYPRQYRLSLSTHQPITQNTNQSRPNTFSNQGRTNHTRSTTIIDSTVKPQCQICSKLGHVAKACYFRYDADPTYRGKPAHYQAYVAQPQSSIASSSEWVLDSGATNHVTHDLNNLSAFFNYDGNDSLQIDNGATLPILHIGSSTLSFSSHSISLTNILHVPNFSKNLLSVSQLLSDNPHLTIEFSNFFCSLKDQITKATILHIPCNNGLFSFCPISLQQP